MARSCTRWSSALAVAPRCSLKASCCILETVSFFIASLRGPCCGPRAAVAAARAAAAARSCSNSARWAAGVNKPTSDVRVFSSGSGSSRSTSSSCCSGDPKTLEDCSANQKNTRASTHSLASCLSLEGSSPLSSSIGGDSLNGRDSSKDGDSSKNGTSAWRFFFERPCGLRGPSQWQLTLHPEEAQSVRVVGLGAAASSSVAAAAAAAAASTPAAAGSLLLPVPVSCLPQQQQLLGVSPGVSMRPEAALAIRVFSAAACPQGPHPTSSDGLSVSDKQQQQQRDHQQQQQQPQQDPEDPEEEEQLLLLPGRPHGEEQAGAKQQQDDEAFMSWKEVWHVFGIAALPMVGFGLMDQLIMIRLGDLLDTTLGVKFGLATLSAAAVGQLCSDTAGVLFGSTIESCANRLGFPAPNLTAAQRASAVFSLTKTVGAASGVCCGCLLGMIQLFFLDLDRADRLKHQQQLDTIFETVLIDGPKLFHCERAALFVYDASRDEVWSKAVFGEEKAIRMQKQKNKCFTTWVIENKAILNCPEASEDPRFNPEFDEKSQQKTRSVLAAPVMDASGEVIAALVFFNKHPQFRGRFSEDDERMVEMMSRHVQIFMEKFEYGAAEDRRMISLPESEHVSQFHALNKPQDAPHSAAVADTTTTTTTPTTPTSSSSSSRASWRRYDEGSGEVKGGAGSSSGKWAWFPSSRDVSDGGDKRGKEETAGLPDLSCSSCCTSGCVLLHSLDPSQSLHSQHLSPNGREPSGMSSMRRNLATAAIAAATAAGIDTVAPDGARAWWVRWLFCLPEEDDYVLLPQDRVPPAAVNAGNSGDTSDGDDESPPGDGGPKPKEGPPPPYWKATFPHLYGPTGTSSARIVEVDRE